MTPTPEQLAAQYARMSETELTELAHSYDSLLDVAQTALRSEFARRGHEPPVVEEPQEWELRRVATVQCYRDLAEAYAGRALLESAGISAWIADENLVRCCPETNTSSPLVLHPPDTQKYVRHVERKPTKQAGFSPGKYQFFETRLSS